MDHTYYPEGMFPESLQARGMTRDQLKKASFWRRWPAPPQPVTI